MESTPASQHPPSGQSEVGVIVGVTVGETVGVGEGVSVGETVGLTVGVGDGLPPQAPPVPVHEVSVWKYGRFDCAASYTQHRLVKLEEHSPTGVPS